MVWICRFHKCRKFLLTAVCSIQLCVPNSDWDYPCTCLQLCQFLLCLLLWILLYECTGTDRSESNISCMSPGLRIWAACHKHWAYSRRFVGKTRRATRQPTPVSPILSCTLPWLPTHLWVPLAHHRTTWTGNVRAGSALLLQPCVVLPLNSVTLV